MIFLNSLFGYLSLLIIVKWYSGSQADLYHVMIYMFLSPTDDLGENQLFEGQKFLQVLEVLMPLREKKKKIVLLNWNQLSITTFLHYQLLLLLSALTAVPWMLFPKPFLLKKQNEEVGDKFFSSLLYQLLYFILLYFSLSFIPISDLIFSRGTKVNPTPYFTTQMRIMKWNNTTVPAAMSLISVRFLYTNLYIP